MYRMTLEHLKSESHQRDYWDLAKMIQKPIPGAYMGGVEHQKD
jgi:hypothetical protein